LRGGCGADGSSLDLLRVEQESQEIKQKFLEAGFGSAMAQMVLLEEADLIA
jgi:hypothetical protein